MKRKKLWGSVSTVALVLTAMFSPVAHAVESDDTNSGVHIESVAHVESDELDVKLELLNEAPGGTWDKGEVAEFRVSFTNKTSVTRGLEITATNLENLLGKCKYMDSSPDVEYSCYPASDSRKATHTITDADVAAGEFKPYATVYMHETSGYLSKVVQVGSAGELPTANDVTTTLALSNPKADGVPWYTGEVMKFNVTLINSSDKTRAFESFTSNLTSWEGCKWVNPAPGQTKECPNATHTVTAEDVDRGYFTPNITFLMYPGTAYTSGTGVLVPTTYGEKIPVATNALSITSFEAATQSEQNAEIGDELIFNVTFTNVGNQEITATQGSESTVLLSEECSQPLAAGESRTCVVTYIVNKNDVCTGSVNVALALEARAGENYAGSAASTARASIAKNCPVAVGGTKAPDADPTLTAKEPQLTMVQRMESTGNIRIPAIAVAPNGDILAAFDYRPLNGTIGASADRRGGDSPNENSIMQRRSTDGGKTWEPATTVAAGQIGSHGYSDPSYVVDRETGTIFNFHVYSQKAGLFKNIATPYVLKDDGTVDETNDHTINFGLSVSHDNGYNWEQRVITSQVLAPLLRDGHKIIGCFATSGAGTQKQAEPHKGRLLQQAACVVDTNNNNITEVGTDRVVAITIYSDDHGETWHAGNPTDVTALGSTLMVFDENKVVELGDGSLMLNSRTSRGAGKNHRLVAKSYDGGVTWVEYGVDESLNDPGNNAQVIRAFPNAKPGTLRSQVLLFSNTNKQCVLRADGTEDCPRVNGTLWISYDNGSTWDTHKTFRSAGTGYTTMAIQPDGSIGILMEPDSGGWNSIGYMNVTLAWVDPELKSELKAQELAEQSATDFEAIDAISLSDLFTRNDPLLDDAVEITGLPSGLAYNPETSAIEGTPTVRNTAEQTYNVSVTLTEAEDGTGRPRTATASFALKLAPAPTYHINYEFISGTDAMTLPAEVTDLLPSTPVAVNGTEVTPTQPANTRVSVDGGTWIFTSYDKTQATIARGDVTFVGTWVFEPTKDDDGEDPVIEPTAVTPQQPHTVDPSALDPADCDTPPYVTVPSTPGVAYTVKVGDTLLVPTDSGRYVYNYGETVTVTASAEDGFAFTDNAVTHWVFTAKKNAQCQASNPPGEDNSEAEGSPEDPSQGSSAQGSAQEQASSSHNVTSNAQAGNNREFIVTPAKKMPATGSNMLGLVTISLVAILGGAGIITLRKNYQRKAQQ